jgi:nitroreductase
MEERARSRARNGPCLLVLIARIDEAQPEIPAHEQWAAIGAALSQMLLAAEALGFAGGILSGRKTQTRALRTALEVGDSESIVGFITLGTLAGKPAPVPASGADPSLFLTRWPPSKP